MKQRNMRNSGSGGLRGSMPMGTIIFLVTLTLGQEAAEDGRALFLFFDYHYYYLFNLIIGII